MFGYLYDLKGTGALTIASLPKTDWCRIAFVVDEYNVNREYLLDVFLLNQFISFS